MNIKTKFDIGFKDDTWFHHIENCKSLSLDFADLSKEIFYGF